MNSARSKRPTGLGKENVERRTLKIANRKSQIANPKVIGFTGPGGAGKTTLIDELVLRFLNQQSKGPNRDFVARPQRSRQRRVAGRSRNDDQFAG